MADGKITKPREGDVQSNTAGEFQMTKKIERRIKSAVTFAMGPHESLKVPRISGMSKAEWDGLLGAADLAMGGHDLSNIQFGILYDALCRSGRKAEIPTSEEMHQAKLAYVRAKHARMIKDKHLPADHG